MTTPFTYSIVHIPSGRKYYGVRYADGCHPDDLGTTYFSSSKTINQLINEGKLKEFEFKVRRTFLTKQEAVTWESKVLKRVGAADSKGWFNQHNGDGKLVNKGGYKLTEKTKRNQSKHKTLDHKIKLTEHLAKVRTSPKWTEERRIKQREAMLGNTLARGHSRIVSDEEKQLKRERMLGNTISKGVSRKHTVKCCPHCGKEGKGGNMTRYHFDNCKHN